MRGINWPINCPNPSNNDIAFFVCKHFLTDKAHYRKIDFLPVFIHTICRINFSILLVLHIYATTERSYDMVASCYEYKNSNNNDDNVHPTSTPKRKDHRTESLNVRFKFTL